MGLVDPSGHDAFVDVTTALGVVGTILSQSLPLFQNIAYQLYFNLYRVPQLIDAVSNVLLFAQGAVAAGSAATSVIEQMATNLQNSTKTLPPGGGPMGNTVEDIAGRNLLRNAQSYDYFDPENQVAGQIQGTRATATPKALMAVIQKGVGKLTDAPDVVDTRFESGQRAQIVKSDLKVRFLVQAIPDEPVSWDFKACIQQVEQLEESTGVVIKIVPTPGLD